MVKFDSADGNIFSSKRRCFTSNQTTNFGVLLLMAEIRRSPVEVGRLSHHPQGFIHPRVVLGDFFHQQYVRFRRSTKPEKGKHGFFPSSIRQSHILDHVLCVVQHGRNWPIRRLRCCDGFHLRQPYNRLLLLEEIPNNHLTSIRNPVHNGDLYHISTDFAGFFPDQQHHSTHSGQFRLGCCCVDHKSILMSSLVAKVLRC